MWNLFVKARTSAWIVLASATALVACGDSGADGSGGGTTGSTGQGGDSSSSQGGSGQGAGSQGGAGQGGAGVGGSGGGLGEPIFEGVFWVEHATDSNGETDATTMGLFWEPGSALGSVRDYWDDTFATGFPLAVGECAQLMSPADPGYTPKTVGPEVIVRIGGADIVVADGPPADDYWGTSTQSNVDQLMTTPFTLAIDPGDDEVPAVSASPFGPLAEATVPTGTVCTHGTACTFTVVPSKPVTDFLFAIGTQYVCRANGTTGEVTMSVAALAAVPTGTYNGKAMLYDREQILMGASPVELLKVTHRVFPIVIQ